MEAAVEHADRNILNSTGKAFGVQGSSSLDIHSPSTSILGNSSMFRNTLGHWTMMTYARKLIGYSLARFWPVLISTLAPGPDVLSE